MYRDMVSKYHSTLLATLSWGGQNTYLVVLCIILGYNTGFLFPALCQEFVKASDLLN